MNNKIKHLYEFENFRVDLSQKCLWRGAEIVSLTPKAFETLVVLIENCGKIVGKEDLLNKVWANTFVEESTLTQNISTLRKTLALQPNGKQFIETVPRRGYRFVGDVREVADDAEIFVVETHTKTHIVAEQQIHDSDSEIHDSDSEILRNDIDEEAEKSKNPLSIPIAPALFSSNKILLGAGILFCAAIVIGGFAAAFYFKENTPQFEEKFQRFQMTKLTSSGDIFKVAVSPDGKYVALVEKKDDLQTVYLRQTNNANTIEIIPSTKDEITGITFSPDSEYIYYSAYPSSQEELALRIGVLYKVPILGGPRAEVLRDIDSSVAISSDYKNYAFVRHLPGERKSALIIFNVENGKETRLSERPWRDRFSANGLSWSPDGKNIAAVVQNMSDAAKPFEILVTNVETAKQISLTPEPWSWIGQISWLGDGTGLVISAFPETSPNFTDEIWFVSYPEGKIRRITNDIIGSFGIGITKDSDSIVTVRSERVSSFWVSPKNQSSEASIINKNITDAGLMKLGMNWTPDGKIIYSTSQNGNADIWTVNADGSNPRQLTGEESADYEPVASPDNRYLVFISNRSGSPNIWRMNPDGTDQKQITNFKYVFSPSVSPDGNRIYFGASQGRFSNTFLWRISPDGENILQMTNLQTGAPRVSPDGKYIACSFPEKSGNPQAPTKFKLTLLSAADGSVVKQFDESISGGKISPVWTPDSKAVSYTVTKNGVTNIWSQPIDGSPPQKITDSKTEEIFRYGWSKDYQKLAFEKGMTINDVVIIRHLRQ